MVSPSYLATLRTLLMLIVPVRSSSKRSKMEEEKYDQDNVIPMGFSKTKRYIAREHERKPDGPFGGMDPASTKYYLVKRYLEIIKESSFEVRVPAILLLFTKVTRQSLENWVDKARPFSIIPIFHRSRRTEEKPWHWQMKSKRKKEG